MSLLRLSDMSTGYGKKQVLFDVSLDVNEGETLLLFGSNGSGKSTLLKSVYGLLDIWNGTIEFDGEPLHTTTMRTPSHLLLDKGIMYVPQKNELFEDMSVMDNLRSSLLHIGDKHETENRIDEVLTKMPQLQNLRKQEAGRLSGGERKHLSLGMVLANRPKLLLYDEPLAGVSEDNIPMVLDWLAKIRDNGTTLIIVEHHVTEMLAFSTRNVGLKLGHIYSENLNSLDDIKSFIV